MQRVSALVKVNSVTEGAWLVLEKVFKSGNKTATLAIHLVV